MTKQPIFFILILFVSSPVFFLGSCKSEHLTPNCDTLNMSYTYNVVPILKNNCYSCHSSGNSVGSIGILLDSYHNLMNFVDTTNVNFSYLLGDIRHDPSNSAITFTPMPYMKPMLDSCSINQIVAWVKQGAKNN
jgi:hypothetical protein